MVALFGITSIFKLDGDGVVKPNCAPITEIKGGSVEYAKLSAYSSPGVMLEMKKSEFKGLHYQEMIVNITIEM